ncbi:MAG: DUF4363 family protein [Ruminiclostridium sp.]
MRKFLIITIPTVTIVFFILIMLSGDFLKRPLGKADDIPESIQLIINDIKSESWDAADEKTERLSKAWDKVVKRVQFSSERDEINALYVNIARLHGAIWAKDKSGSLEELCEAYEHWDQLGK